MKKIRSAVLAFYSLLFKYKNIQVFEISNTPIILNWTAFLYLALTALALPPYLGLPLGIILMCSVLLHELGHVFVAQKLGIGTGIIQLTIVGGAANIEIDEHTEPKQEILIAIAGPLVSIALCGVGFIPTLFLPDGHVQLFFELFAFINGMLAIYNLLPSYPMDGGRILRSLLRLKLDYYKSTVIALDVSIVVSSLIMILSYLILGWFTLLATGFILLMAIRERKMLEEIWK